MIEIDFHRPYESIEPFLEGTVIATDYQNGNEFFSYEELCSRYNRLLEEVRYLTALNRVLQFKNDSADRRITELERSLNELNET